MRPPIGASPARVALPYAWSCMIAPCRPPSRRPLEAALQLGPLALLAVLYGRRARTLAQRAHPVPGWRQGCFYGGLSR